MKIQCDMCEKKEAAVYCTADEASLCHGCDRRVHHANKLASKHRRFSLQNSSDQPPRCDICQDKKAFLFCKEDRAILCRQCDISIHGANEHTKYHNRFLLAGVKLSNSSTCYDNSSDQTLCSSNSNESNETESIKSSIVSKNQNISTNYPKKSWENYSDGVSQEKEVSIPTSSISEYLMETLPGWHVDEFLDSFATDPCGLYEVFDSGVGACTLPFMSHDTDNNGDMGTLWSEDLGILVNSSSSSSSMDHQKSRTSSYSKRFLFNEDQFTFNSSSIKRPRQLL